MSNNNDNSEEYEQDQDVEKYKSLKYETYKNEFIKKVQEKQKFDENFRRETKLLIIDMIRILRYGEKKEKAAIKQQIKNDFLELHVYQATKLRELVDEEFDPMSPIKKRQKITIATDGSQILEEGSEDDDSGGDDNDDIITRREKAKEAMLTKQIKKGSGQMPKIKPTVDSSTLEQEDEQEDEKYNEDEDNAEVTSAETILKESNNIVIDGIDHIKLIAEGIKQGKAIVVVFDKNLEVITIRYGKVLTE